MARHQTIAGLRERHAREERQLILGALERCAWSLTTAASRLGVAPSSLQRLIESHDIEALYREHTRRSGPTVNPRGALPGPGCPGRLSPRAS